jgi:hypothetical protein
VPPSGVVCSADGACLPLTTTTPISDGAGRGDAPWLLLSTAALLLASEGCAAHGACTSLSATVPLASGVCDAGGAWLSVSAPVLLIGWDCGGDHAGGSPVRRNAD